MAPSDIGALSNSEIFSPAGKKRIAREILVPRRLSSRDESLAAFVRRRLGSDCLERIAPPMVAGITTSDPETLSMQAAMPQFVEMEREHGSVIRALSKRRPAGGTSGPRYGMFATPVGGMRKLAGALAKALGRRLRTGIAVTSLRRRGDRWIVGTTSGPLDADAVVLALPSPAAAKLLRGHDARLAGLLEGIRHAPVATVSLAWREGDLELPRAMGFVVPAVERLFTVACSFTSRKFPGRAPAGVSLVRAFAGGATRPRDAALPPRELTQRVIADLRRLLGAEAAPLFSRATRFPASMPQYRVGHLDRVAEIERRTAGLPRLALCGASYRGVGIPDCVKGGQVAASQAAAEPQ
jgi:protoporphyrinogen/coproporphyrinogen III oxidase